MRRHKSFRANEDEDEDEDEDEYESSGPMNEAVAGREALDAGDCQGALTEVLEGQARISESGSDMHAEDEESVEDFYNFVGEFRKKCIRVRQADGSLAGRRRRR